MSELMRFDAEVYFEESHPYAKPAEVYIAKAVDIVLAAQDETMETLRQRNAELAGALERLRAALQALIAGAPFGDEVEMATLLKRRWVPAGKLDELLALASASRPSGGPQMSVDVFADPSFAGLHWSIPRDTPREERARAHLAAAYTARAKRDRDEANTVRVVLENHQTQQALVRWANGSLTWESWHFLHSDPRRIIRRLMPASRPASEA